MTPARRVVRALATERARVAGSVWLLAATIGASVALMGTSAWLISTAALHPSISVLQVAVVGVRFFGIARGVCRYLERLVSHDATFRLIARLRVDVFRGLVPMVPGRWPEVRSGDLLARLVGDVDTLEHAFVRVVAPVLAASVVVAAVAAVLARVDAWVGMAATAGLLAAATLAPWCGWRLGRAAGEEAVRARADLGVAVVDAVQGLADLVAFGRAHDQATRVEHAGVRLARAQVRGGAAAASGGSLVMLIADVSALAVLAAAVPLVRAGEVAGVQLAVVALVTLAAFEAVSSLPAAAQGLAATRAAAARVFAFEPPGDEPVESLSAAQEVPERIGHIEVRGLSFTYPGSDAPVLRGLGLDLDAAGDFVAVVGPSGSGKSTIAHLLVRFWEPPAGTVLVDGVDVLAFGPDEWRRHVALMAQDVRLFTGTLAENVRMAWPDAPGEVVEAAVGAAGLDEVIARLPDGDGTWVGEQGALLSGGERQRLALARALLKPASLLVLDEPTASVDPDTEQLISATIASVAQRRAVLLITHRTAGLERAREILVVHDGAVVERGSYETLMARGTWFPRMVALERDALPESPTAG